MSVLHAYFLVGPTAVGKSFIAQRIAALQSYHILAADSMQVYRGMDVGTAKPGPDDRSLVCHHGIDLIDPSELFNVWQYRRYALDVLLENRSSGRETIIVGGTGLYVKSLLDGLADESAGDATERSYWTGILEKGGIETLQAALQAKDQEAFCRLADKKNPRRLIRALETASLGVKTSGGKWKRGLDSAPIPGLLLPPEELNARIASRVDAMYDAGLIDEARSLLESDKPLSCTALQAIGYAEVFDFLNGRCSREDAIARTVVRTRQLAKKQRTWFRHQLNVKWIEITVNMETDAIASMVEEHWRKYGPTEIAE